MQQQDRAQRQGQRGDLRAKAVQAIAEPQTPEVDSGGAAIAAQAGGERLVERSENTALRKRVGRLIIIAVRLPQRWR